MTKKENWEQILNFFEAYADILDRCQVSHKQIDLLLSPPKKKYPKGYSADEVRLISNYIFKTGGLLESVSEYVKLYGYFTPESWRNLSVTSPSMPEFANLRRLKRQVQARWKVRPKMTGV
jgi:hypothetical protein